VLLEHALAVLEEAPETPETLGLTVDIRIAYASTFMAMKGSGSAEVATLVLHTQELAARLGDAGRLFSALWQLWLVTNATGRYREALQLAQRLLALAGPDSDSSTQLEAHHSLCDDAGGDGRGRRDHSAL
jgi:hypothetical protein